MGIVAVIGSGFSGLSAAAYLADAGHEVHVFEKNASAGGRARQLKEQGYLFDMGPSWYWMPDVFDRFFGDFGYKTSDFYKLQQLDPAFEMVLPEDEKISIPANYQELISLFESIEKGAGEQLQKFMKEAQFKYETGMQQLVYSPGLSISEFASASLLKDMFRLEVFRSLSSHIRKYFRDPRLITLMEFPVLFLGAMPEKTPALYSLMNYAGLKLGTYYPEGGFGNVIDSIVHLATKKGASFHFNSPVQKIIITGSTVTGIKVKDQILFFDAVIASADYQYVEKHLLPDEYRNYNEEYWAKKTFAPSCLIFYIGVNKKLENLQHHTLFFENDFSQHAREIYIDPKWPTAPLFYVCCPSKSDSTVAPEGHENLFVLMPLATGLEDSEELREKYFQMLMSRLEKHAGTSISEDIGYLKSYCINDFKEDYHAYNGNAYGLANTLMQTAILKPKITNKKLNNLFYTGQLTVPGPGVPPALISGKIVATQLIKFLKSQKYEINL